VRGKISKRIYSSDSSSITPIIIMSRRFGTVFGYSVGKLARHPQFRLITELFLSLVMEGPRGDKS
jgi:hypothetical protein